jgi:hypothetical protein
MVFFCTESLMNRVRCLIDPLTVALAPQVVRAGMIFATWAVAAATQAATVTFSTPTARAVSQAESTGGAPAGGTVYSYFVTTDADILSIGFVQITPDGLYQSPVGSNFNPVLDDRALLAAFPALGADSYIDTPGNTVILGVDMPGDGTANSAWGDTSDDGARQNFKFAQLTFPQGARGFFSGNVTVSSAAGPESFNFNFPIPIPEPTSLSLATVALLGVVAPRRRPMG